MAGPTMRRDLLIGGGVLAVGLTFVVGSVYSMLSVQAPPQGPGRQAVGAAPRLPSDPRLAERAMGAADAPVVVREYFSLTCTHCAAFAGSVLPRIRTELVDRGLARYVFEDFPIDGLALSAAVLARSLPPDRYVPFVLDLLSSQNSWAFGPGAASAPAAPGSPLAQRAAAFGMTAAAFDAAMADRALADAILDGRQRAAETAGVRGTPSFSFNGGRLVVGDIAFDDFASRVSHATAG